MKLWPLIRACLIGLVWLFIMAIFLGCTGRYVARLNADCRVLKDYTIVDTNACVVCAKTGKAVIACALESN